MKRLIATLVLCVFSVVPAVAQEEDAEGCSDSKLLTRISGCYIDHCESNDFDESQLQAGKLSDETGEAPVQTIEGKKSVISYACPGRISTLQIVRNAEAALKKAGFTSVYSGEGTGYARVTTLRKGGVWVQVGAIDYAGDTTGYEVTVAEAAEMEQEMVADATAWADEISRTGRVAVYGIEFDTGKATIRSEAEPVLREIASLLSNETSLRLRVEGHTDNVGAAASNQALSQQRAEAVVAWLAKNGVDRSRLTAAGAGASKPVADNSTEEGRAKNRRVELVKM